MTDTVIFDDVGPALMRRMLIMRVGCAVDMAEWLKRVPEGRQAMFDEFELGESVIRHYLKLEWKPRELVRMMPEWVEGWGTGEGGRETGDGRRGTGDGGRTKIMKRAICVPAVVWWLDADAGETISGGLRSAAECYWGGLDRWPRVGFVWKEVPALTLPSPEGRGEMQLAVASWVPKGCVVVV